jgi:hypothetical protein
LFFNLFLEASKQTASVNAALTMTFDRRRFECPPPKIQNARLGKDYCSSATLKTIITAGPW